MNYEFRNLFIKSVADKDLRDTGISSKKLQYRYIILNN